MTKLELFRNQHEALHRAKEFLSHFTATGREGERYRVHSLGNILPELSIQYYHCGQNYWRAKDSCPELIPFITAEMMLDLPRITRRAVEKMEADMSKSREEAKKEFLHLFGTEMPELT